MFPLLAWAERNPNTENEMNLATKAWLLGHILRWRLTWNWRNTHAGRRVPGNPRFMSAREAVKLIPDGATVGVSGFAASMRSSIIYWAIREAFEESGHPRDLTAITMGGSGGRGRIPGTMEELALPGLIKRFITGHAETYKTLLRLTDEGHLEFHCVPLGMLVLAVGSMDRGINWIVSDTGAGTFVDPRCGRGTPIVGDYPQLVEISDGRLKYTFPPVNVAIFNAPAADRDGNIYSKNAALVADSVAMAKAARYNGGTVIANVGQIVEKGHGEVLLPAEEVDALVVWKGTEQTASIPHRRYWECFTVGSKAPMGESIARVRFVNQTLGITPRRKPVDDALARLTASIFVEHARKGDYVDIGVGLPEEVSRLLFKSGAMRDITLLNESGVFGGLPTPGIFFGAAVNPEEIISTKEAFERIYTRLDAAILGALEIDSEGNDNVSYRGEKAINYVGPGGFIDLSSSARLVLFCCAWGAGADIRIEGGKVRVIRPGKPKFIERVSEVTFSGPEALKRGKDVFYVTHVGAFRLTARGMELFRVMPGIDVQKDIIEACPMRIVLPEDGKVAVVDASIVTGKGFQLRFAGPPPNLRIGKEAPRVLF